VSEPNQEKRMPGPLPGLNVVELPGHLKQPDGPGFAPVLTLAEAPAAARPARR
jgi:hypothetical protein